MNSADRMILSGLCWFDPITPHHWAKVSRLQSPVRQLTKSMPLRPTACWRAARAKRKPRRIISTSLSLPPHVNPRSDHRIMLLQKRFLPTRFRTRPVARPIWIFHGMKRQVILEYVIDGCEMSCLILETGISQNYLQEKTSFFLFPLFSSRAKLKSTEIDRSFGVILFSIDSFFIFVLVRAIERRRRGEWRVSTPIWWSWWVSRWWWKPWSTCCSVPCRSGWRWWSGWWSDGRGGRVGRGCFSWASGAGSGSSGRRRRGSEHAGFG